MSYILDALKKSQAEQAGEGVSLRMDRRTSRRGLTPWLAGLALVLMLNCGILLWVFVFDSNELGNPAPLPGRPAATVERAHEPVPEPLLQHAQPRPTVQTVARPVAPIERIALQDLPAREQTLYNGFIYSSHIYTDDPSLCAIVVDGQRLKAGDAFKGLRVTAITEGGVIFEETRQGVSREIEVAVLDLWGS